MCELFIGVAAFSLLAIMIRNSVKTDAERDMSFYKHAYQNTRQELNKALAELNELKER